MFTDSLHAVWPSLSRNFQFLYLKTQKKQSSVVTEAKGGSTIWHIKHFESHVLLSFHLSIMQTCLEIVKVLGCKSLRGASAFAFLKVLINISSNVPADATVSTNEAPQSVWEEAGSDAYRGPLLPCEPLELERKQQSRTRLCSMLTTWHR